MFQSIHDLSHPSGRTTLAIITRMYVWDSVRRDVLQWSRACEVCARNKVARHTHQPITPISNPITRFEHVHVDVVGPFPCDQGKRYVLTMMDRTTRWPEAVAIADATTDTILQAFLDAWIAKFGIPRIVTTDRGAQFTSQAWTKTLAQLGISVSTTTAYHPQANGLVERFHRSLKNALRCSTTETTSWTRSLPWILLGLRNAPRTDTATSPAEVLFGTPLRVPDLCFKQELVPTADTARQLQLARENVANYLPPRLDGRKFRHSPFIPKDLRKCDFVFVRTDTLAKPPLAPRYVGPYKVLSRNWQNSTFKIEMSGKMDTVLLGRLKAASTPPRGS